MVMSSSLWYFWWEDEGYNVPFVPPFLNEFVWGDDPDTPTSFDSFVWSTSNDVFGWR